MLIFLTDPHIGVNRKANTTLASRRLLYERTIKTPVEGLVNLRESQLNAVICLGDLFDTYSNKEQTILDAAAVCSGIDFCLAGNHDSINDSTKESSLGLIDEMCATRIIRAPVGKSLWYTEQFKLAENDVRVYMVPHHSAQELFEASLIECADDAGDEAINIVLVHCNYGLSEGMLNDTTLNLTEEDVEYLLDNGIDYVLFGHDHGSREPEHWEGRVRILGNTQPTSFSDIGDKYITTFDGLEFTKHLIWDSHKRYVELDVANDWPELSSEVEFVNVAGEVQPANAIYVGKMIQALWDAYPNMLAIRNSVKIKEIEQGLEVKPGEMSTATIFELVDAHLKDSDLYPLWQKMTEGLQQES